MRLVAVRSNTHRRIVEQPARESAQVLCAALLLAARVLIGLFAVVCDPWQGGFERNFSAVMAMIFFFLKCVAIQIADILRRVMRPPIPAATC